MKANPQKIKILLATGAVLSIVVLSCYWFVGPDVDNTPKSLPGKDGSSTVVQQTVEASGGARRPSTGDHQDGEVRKAMLTKRIPPRLLSVAQMDPVKALQMAEDDAKASGRYDLVPNLAEYLLLKDFNLLKTVAPFLRNRNDWETVLSVAVPEALKSNQANALHLINELRGESRGQALRMSVQTFLNDQDFTKAITAQIDMPFSSERNAAIMAIGGKFGQLDEKSFFAWLPQLLEGDERDRAIKAYAHALIGRGAMTNLSPLLKLTQDSGTRQEIIEALARSEPEMGKSPTSGSAILQLSSAEIIEKKLASLNNEQPLDAFVLEANKLTDGGGRLAAYQKYFRENANADPKGWAEKALGVDEGAFAYAVAGALGTWLTIDTEAASEWVQRIPPGQKRDIAIREFALQMARIDLAAAQQAISWISNAAMQKDVAARLER